MKKMILCLLGFVFLISCTEEEAVSTLSAALLHHTWEVQKSYQRYEDGELAREENKVFEMQVLDGLIAYLPCCQPDSILLEPTADQEQILWLVPFFTGYSVHEFDVLQWNAEEQHWLRDEVEFQGTVPYSGVREEFLLKRL